MTVRLYKRVADELTCLIKSGQFKVGERLPTELELAERFQVSRPTVREAVIALEIAGLVGARKGSGTYVKDWRDSTSLMETDEDVGAFDLTDARLVIEGEAAAIAAINITSKEIERLEKALQHMIEVDEACDSHSIISLHADKEFHMIIARATRNSSIERVIEHLWTQMESSTLTRTMFEKAHKMGFHPDIREHHNILSALKSGDANAARKAMRAHLTIAIENLYKATEYEAVERAKKKVSADRERRYNSLGLQTRPT